jgi:hypothetical protein
MTAISDKIRIHTVGEDNEMFKSFELFGRPSGGITKKHLKFKLNQWAIHPPPDVLEELWNLLDEDGNGILDYQEFLGIFGNGGLNAGELCAHPLHGKNDPYKDVRTSKRGKMSMGDVELGKKRVMQSGKSITPGLAAARKKFTNTSVHKHGSSQSVRLALGNIATALNKKLSKGGGEGSGGAAGQTKTKTALNSLVERLVQAMVAEGNPGGRNSKDMASEEAIKGVLQRELQLQLPSYLWPELRKVDQQSKIHIGTMVGGWAGERAGVREYFVALNCYPYEFYVCSAIHPLVSISLLPRTHLLVRCVCMLLLVCIQVFCRHSPGRELSRNLAPANSLSASNHPVVNGQLAYAHSSTGLSSFKANRALENRGVRGDGGGARGRGGSQASYGGSTTGTSSSAKSGDGALLNARRLLVEAVAVHVAAAAAAATTTTSKQKLLNASQSSPATMANLSNGPSSSSPKRSPGKKHLTEAEQKRRQARRMSFEAA